MWWKCYEILCSCQDVNLTSHITNVRSQFCSTQNKQPVQVNEFQTKLLLNFKAVNFFGRVRYNNEWIDCITLPILYTVNRSYWKHFHMTVHYEQTRNSFLFEILFEKEERKNSSRDFFFLLLHLFEYNEISWGKKCGFFFHLLIWCTKQIKKKKKNLIIH